MTSAKLKRTIPTLDARGAARSLLRAAAAALKRAAAVVFPPFRFFSLPRPLCGDFKAGDPKAGDAMGATRILQFQQDRLHQPPHAVSGAAGGAVAVRAATEVCALCTAGIRKKHCYRAKNALCSARKPGAWGAGQDQRETTMSYEWNHTLFRTRADMLDAMAWAWISAHGSNTDAEIERFFTQMTDSDLAAEMIET